MFHQQISDQVFILFSFAMEIVNYDYLYIFISTNCLLEMKIGAVVSLEIH